MPPVSLNVLSLPRRAGKWDHNCTSAPQLLGSKGTPVGTQRGVGLSFVLDVPQYRKVSKATNLSSVSCLYREERSHNFFLCPWTTGETYGLAHIWTSKTRPDNFYLLWPDMCKDQRTMWLALIVSCTCEQNMFLWQRVQGLIDGDNDGRGANAAKGVQGPWKPGAPHITGWVMPEVTSVPTQVFSRTGYEVPWLQADSNYVSRRFLAGTGFNALQTSSVEWKRQIDSQQSWKVCISWWR